MKKVTLYRVTTEECLCAEDIGELKFSTTPENWWAKVNSADRLTEYVDAQVSVPVQVFCKEGVRHYVAIDPQLKEIIEAPLARTVFKHLYVAKGFCTLPWYKRAWCAITRKHELFEMLNQSENCK